TDVLERWLTPAYFSTTTDEWTVPDSYVVDTVANEVTMQIDHFTDFALLDSAPAWAAANPVLTYTFASGRQGWLIFGDANGGSLAPDSIALPNYAAAGGHPGGYLYAVDDVTGGTWFWLRRFTSTVDASAAYSRSLSFELRQTDLDSQYRYPGGDIILEGGATITTSLTYYLPHRPLLHWTPYNVLLHESARWIARRGPFGVPTRATAADFQAVLGNLRGIRIRGEYRDGADTGSLDNVILGDAPPPSLRRVISVGQGGRLAFTTSTTTTLDFPPGMFNLPFTVTVTLTDTSDITNVRSITGSTLLPPAHVFRPVGPAFIIEARRPGGSLLTAFMRPFTITVRYNPAEVSGLQAGSLLVYYRSGNGPWRAITSTLGAGVISVAVDHLTGFAVMGRQSPTYMLYLPLIVRQ
ncbi:MAG: laminin B domain-containing protein, partial [Anaerolineae bacterium]